MNQVILRQQQRRVDKRNRIIRRKKSLVKICVVLFIELLKKRLIRKKPVPETNSMRQGYMLYNEIIAGNINRFKHFTRCGNKDGFMELVEMISSPNGGQLYMAGRNSLISQGQKIMILISTLIGNSAREKKACWELSTSTISRIEDEVITAIKKVYHREVIIETATTPTSSILDDPKFKWFNQPDYTCIGAMDGCFMSACVSNSLQPRFRSRKNIISWNVLGVCDLNLLFTYSLGGWEGSACDPRVSNDALLKGLTTPAHKFRLGDGIYRLTMYCLTPYQGIRYHLREWGARGERPANKEELFNLRHAQLRNCIERAFGILKKMFPILSNMARYPLQKQIDLIMCTIFLYNFIRRRNLFVFNEDDIENDDDNDNDGQNDDINNNDDHAEAVTWRDTIAQNMWDEYLIILVQRGQHN